MPTGKRSKDRLYISQGERRIAQAAAAAGSETVETLPFDACMISQAPFSVPVATRSGTVFDLVNIVPYVRKNRCDPITGNPLTGRDLVRLRFSRNQEGKHYCPVTMSVFGPRSRIVAIATTGNVFSAEALRVNSSSAEPVDLLDGTPYNQAPAENGGDVITIQDPGDPAAVARRRATNLQSKLAGLASASTKALSAVPAPAADVPSAGPAKPAGPRLSAAARRVLAAAKLTSAPEDPSLRRKRQRAAEAAAAAAENGGAGRGSGVGPGGLRFETVADGWQPPETPALAQQAIRALKAGAGSGVAAAGSARSAPAADCAAGSQIAEEDDLYDASDRRRFMAERARRGRAGEDTRDLDMLMTTTDGRAAALTSSAVAVGGQSALAVPPRATLRRLRWRRVAAGRDTAKVTLHIGIGGRAAGRLRFELLCAAAPMACDSFLQLCRRGYHDGVSFHRSIRAFMVQGGDPTGTGTGGSSCWGGVFPSETDRGRASHDARGALAMANSGAHTNASQFYVLYRPAPHLDGKHTVFGRLVGGTDTLRAMELVETGRGDRPSRPVTVDRVEVHDDPFRRDADAAWSQAEAGVAPAPAAAVAAPSSAGTGVGRYLSLAKRAK